MERLREIFNLSPDIFDECLHVMCTYTMTKPHLTDQCALAIVYVVMRKNNMCCSLREMALKAGVKTKGMKKIIEDIMKVVPDVQHKESISDLITVFVSKLNGKMDLELLAQEIGKRAVSHKCTNECHGEFGNYKPSVIAGTSILYANRYLNYPGITYRMVADASRVNQRSFKMTTFEDHFKGMFPAGFIHFVIERIQKKVIKHSGQ